MRPIVCVTMRYGSRRLPGKALIDLGGGLTPVALLAAQLLPQPHPLVFCVPEGEEGDPIASHADSLGLNSHRGSLTDVLGRMLTAAEEFGADTVVRITGDDLFVDPTRLVKLVESHSGADFTYSDLPKGTECQVISTEMLRRMSACEGGDNECWDKQRNPGWAAGAEMRFVPLSPVPAGPETFAIELDTPEDAGTIRGAISRLRAKGLEEPFLVEHLAALHAEEPFPKTKHPVYRPGG